MTSLRGVTPQREADQPMSLNPEPSNEEDEGSVVVDKLNWTSLDDLVDAQASLSEPKALLVQAKGLLEQDLFDLETYGGDVPDLVEDDARIPSEKDEQPAPGELWAKKALLDRAKGLLDDHSSNNESGASSGGVSIWANEALLDLARDLLEDDPRNVSTEKDLETTEDLAEKNSKSERGGSSESYTSDLYLAVLEGDEIVESPNTESCGNPKYSTGHLSSSEASVCQASVGQASLGVHNSSSLLKRQAAIQAEESGSSNQLSIFPAARRLVFENICYQERGRIRFRHIKDLSGLAKLWPWARSFCALDRENLNIQDLIHILENEAEFLASEYTSVKYSFRSTQNRVCSLGPFSRRSDWADRMINNLLLFAIRYQDRQPSKRQEDITNLERQNGLLFEGVNDLNDESSISPALAYIKRRGNEDLQSKILNNLLFAQVAWMAVLDKADTDDNMLAAFGRKLRIILMDRGIDHADAVGFYFPEMLRNLPHNPNVNYSINN